jgi:hypothetical protein
MLTSDYLSLRLRLCRIAKRESLSRKRESATAKPFWAVFHSQHMHASLKGCVCDPCLRQHDRDPHLAFQRRALFRKDIQTNVAYVARYALSLKLAAFGVLPKERHRNAELIPNGTSSFHATFHFPFHETRVVLISTLMGHRILPNSCHAGYKAKQCTTSCRSSSWPGCFCSPYLKVCPLMQFCYGIWLKSATFGDESKGAFVGCGALQILCTLSKELIHRSQPDKILLSNRVKTPSVRRGISVGESCGKLAVQR